VGIDGSFNDTVINAEHNGSVISQASTQSLTLQHLTVVNANNSALVITAGALIISDCLFANSSSVHGGAVSIMGNEILHVWIESSVFDSNSGIMDGGVLHVSLQTQGGVSINLVNNTFRNNTVGLNGGVLFMAVESGLNFQSHVWVSRCLFESNSAALYGGVFIELLGTIGPHPVVQIEHCLFLSNYALMGATIGGGFDTIIQSSKFYNNSAKIGIVYANGGTTSVSDCEFSYSSNSAIWSEGTLYVHRSNFTFNVGNYGGAIFFVGKQLVVDGCNFDQNEAGQGGALYIGGTYYYSVGQAIVTIANSSFINNTATNMQAEVGGGAIGISSSAESQLFIDNCVFYYNRGFIGGAVGCMTEQVFITDSIFSYNDATNMGATVYGLKCILNITTSNFINSTTSGSTMLNNNHITSCVECIFSGNSINIKSTYVGMLIETNKAVLSNCTFSHNVVMKSYILLAFGIGIISNITLYNNQMLYFKGLGTFDLYTYDGTLFLSDSALISASILCSSCDIQSSQIRDSTITQDVTSFQYQMTITESSIYDTLLVASVSVKATNTSFSNSTLSISSANIEIISCTFQNTTIDSMESRLLLEGTFLDAKSVMNLTSSSLQLDGDWVSYPGSFLCLNSTVYYSTTMQALPNCPVQLLPQFVNVVGAMVLELPFYIFKNSPQFFQFSLTNVTQLDLTINSNGSQLSVTLNDTFNLGFNSFTTLSFSWNGQNGSHVIAQLDTFNLSLVSSSPFIGSGSSIVVESMGQTVYLPSCVVETRTKQLSGQGKIYGTLYFYDQWSNPMASSTVWNISSDTGYEIIPSNQYSYIFSFEPLESNQLITYQSIYLNGTKIIEIRSELLYCFLLTNRLTT